jgi:hypothetical protein
LYVEPPQVNGAILQNASIFFVMNFVVDLCSKEFLRAISNRMESSIVAILREY